MHVCIRTQHHYSWFQPHVCLHQNPQDKILSIFTYYKIFILYFWDKFCCLHVGTHTYIMDKWILGILQIFLLKYNSLSLRVVYLKPYKHHSIIHLVKCLHKMPLNQRGPKAQNQGKYRSAWLSVHPKQGIIFSSTTKWQGLNDHQRHALYFQILQKHFTLLLSG